MKYYTGLILLQLVVALFQATRADDAQTKVQNTLTLAKALEKDYEKFVDPGNTTLKLGVSLICAQYDLSEKRLHTRVFERYSWNDWRLRWDPSKFGGVKLLKVPSDLIWKPDVRLFNALETEERDDIRAIVMSDGTVYYFPTVTYSTLCGTGDDPRDRKGHCHLSLRAFTSDAEDLPLSLYEGGVDTQFYLDDCPHVTSNVEAHIKTTKYDCCPNLFASLEIDFDLEEKKDLKQDGRIGRYHGGDVTRKRRPGIDCRWPNC